MTARNRQRGVLFVCLGNICRSPLAGGIFLHLARKRDALDRFDVDSCGTGAWHAGEDPDPRSVQVALRHGIPLDHKARQLDPATDFDRFGLVIAMDRTNRRSIIHASETRSRPAPDVRLMRSFDPALVRSEHADLDVPDPYSGGDEGFEVVYEMLLSSCTGLLDHLLEPSR